MPSEHAVKVVYKGTENTEFFVIANSEQVSKWKSDKSTPLVDVVQSFDVYTTSAGGSTGEYIKPPKGVLESNFNTSNTDEIVKKIISEGEEKGF
ncbi:SDO1-like protein C21C3.19 [Choanephora cucurbitarum]|uniref:SDO1-like protein C21C3.19 n=1 Tax=Choanephora cucurbitarum TaxID=101091 RepID=A0A1C7NPP5_9FUNG|nr:SDO1-like protein C21C3.19 [Choanephora cucurbitarum]